MSVNRIYCATGLTGGTEGKLDTIDGVNLIDKDMAIAIDQTTVYLYALDEDSGAAESSPTVIAPDTNPTTKRWILQSLHVNDITIADDIILATDDVKIGDTLEVVGATQFGDADGTGAGVTFYSNTAGDFIVYDPAGKTFTLTDISLVINGTTYSDNTITDDGTFVITTSEVTAIRTTAAAGSDAGLQIGLSDTNRGYAKIYADNDTAGPYVQFQVPPNNDGDGTTAYTIQVNGNSDDFYIGADNDTDMLKFIGGATPTIQATCAFDVDAALTATTVDADTDFTVGGTVLSDAMLTDDGSFTLNTATGTVVTNSGAAGSTAYLYIGSSDSKRGYIFMRSDDDTAGPNISMQVPPNNDGNSTTEWMIQIEDNTDDLYIGADNDLDMLTFLGGATPTIQANCAFDVNAALTATTVDADTDFTVGGTVITDNTITDDGTFEITAATSVALNGAGGILSVGVDDDTPGQLYLYGGGNGESGGVLRLHVEAAQDTTTEYFQFAVSAGADDLNIGTEDDTSALQLAGGGTLVFNINCNWNAAGETCSNLGTVTTADIDGGTLDDVTIGGATPAAGTFTTVDASTDVTLASGADLVLTEPTTDSHATAIVLTGQDLDSNAEGTAGRSGGIVYMNASSQWNTADKDASATAGVVPLAMVQDTTASGDPVNLMLYGIIRETAWSWTVGAPLYLGDDGAMTHTAPSGSGDIVRVVGHALTADIVWFNPSPDWVEIS